MRWVAAVLFLSMNAYATFCGEPGPVCSRFPGARAVFIGTVIGSDDDTKAWDRYPSRYLVRVEESFRGLPPGQKEVFVNPGYISGFYTYYAVGESYLFFGYTNFGPSGEKPWPGEWAGKRNLLTLDANRCTGSKPLLEAEAEIGWIRSALREEPTTYVAGVVYQRHDPQASKESSVPLPEATVTLKGDGGTWTAQSGPDGEYLFRGVAPGKYTLGASRKPWEDSQRWPVHVHPGGCEVRSLVLRSEGSIDGTVRWMNGTPAAGVVVKLVRLLPDGSLAKASVDAVSTKSGGRFTMQDVPAGRFVLGVNLNERAKADQPWLPLFLSGSGVAVESLSAARVFELGPNEVVSEVEMQLPPPLPPRTVQVRIYWADGTPAVGASIWVLPEGQVAVPGTSHTAAQRENVVTLTLMEDYSYSLGAQWVSMERGQEMQIVDSRPVVLPAGKMGTVAVRLLGNKPKRTGAEALGGAGR